MEALRAIVPISQILFGTDYPYRTFDWTAQMLAQDAIFNPREISDIFNGNMSTLVARGH